MSHKQNINLLEELVVHPVSTFNSKLMLQVAVGGLLVLILIYVLAANVQREKDKKITSLQATKKELLQRLDDYQDQIAKKSDEDLPVGIMNTEGFFRHLNDLAKTTPDGVWLKNIIITEPHENVILEGSSVSPIGVTSLIKALNKAENFRDKKFRELSLEKNPETKEVDFKVSTYPPVRSDQKKEREYGAAKLPTVNVQTPQQQLTAVQRFAEDRIDAEKNRKGKF